MQPKEIEVAYTRVLNTIYRQDLPPFIKKKLNSLIRKKLFAPDLLPNNRVTEE
jgi:hypothetical protein